MIQVHNLKKKFDDFQALNGVDMHVGKGDIYGLVGPNGAGKSTLIRHLTGVYKADEGEILIDGEPVFEKLSANLGKAILSIANKKVCTAYTTCTCVSNQYKNTPAMIASSCGSMTYGKSAIYSTTSINGNKNNNCNCNSNCCNVDCSCPDSSISDGTIRYSKPYIFNTDFYNGFVDSMNDLELLVYNYLVRNELNIKKILELASQYRKMPLMDAFYKVPVLMELVDVAIRKIT